jgi:hypothetical protein
MVFIWYFNGIYMVFTSDLLPTKSEGAARLRPTFVLPTNSFPGIFLVVLEILYIFAIK